VTIPAWSLYQWLRTHREADGPAAIAAQDAATEIRRLKSALWRVTEERDTLKKGHGVLRQAAHVRYAFIREQQSQHAARTLCRMMRMHPSGYYAWLACPQSRRRREDEVLLGAGKLWEGLRERAGQSGTERGA
jgi:hypothetical protein